LLTYEDMTGYFLKAAAGLMLNAHPEYWLNTSTLEREFACTCHAGSCEEAEMRSSCTVSFTWGPLDTALSLDGPVGICDFFHEAEHDCPHLHTSAIPPLVLDLAYTRLHVEPISNGIVPIMPWEAASASTSILEETILMSGVNSSSPRCNSQFGVNRGQMSADRADADPESRARLRVGGQGKDADRQQQQAS